MADAVGPMVLQHTQHVLKGQATNGERTHWSPEKLVPSARLFSAWFLFLFDSTRDQPRCRSSTRQASDGQRGTARRRYGITRVAQIWCWDSWTLPINGQIRGKQAESRAQEQGHIHWVCSLRPVSDKRSGVRFRIKDAVSQEIVHVGIPWWD